MNTIVLQEGINQHTEMDRWSVSRDGTTLKIHRQIVSHNGETETTLVYEREGTRGQLSARPSETPAAVTKPGSFVVPQGTRIPLALINSEAIGCTSKRCIPSWSTAAW